MTVSPIDYRYGRMEVKRIFSEAGRLKYMLKVEAMLAKAEADLGIIPAASAEIISSHANLRYVKPKRVKEIEREIGHDVMALVKSLSEVCGESGKFVHLGATSNDILDTATALQLKNFFSYLEEDLWRISSALCRLAEKYKNTIMMGRTHGQPALPITFGLKMSVYLAEMMRHIDRLNESKNRILVGKFMGAVGTGAALGKDTLRVQEKLLKSLDLGEEEGPTQIVDRDRFVEYVSLMAGIATTLEKLATEIRMLQRP
ncbi:MAG: lyase family protein, partial [Thermoplasmatales archaeon]